MWFHAYPPGWNLLTGALLALGDAASLAGSLFGLLGLVLVNALFVLGRALELSRRTAFALALAFSLTPPTLYFEHLYHETYVTAFLLVLAALLLYRAVSSERAGTFAAFFSACALASVFRSTFHPLWLVGMVALALAVVRPAARRRVLVGAIGPLFVVGALCVKNAALFGFFGLTSQTSFLVHSTVRRLPPELLNAWVREGKLSKLASISVYAGPSAYDGLLPPPPAGLPSLVTALERPTTHQPNFNHWYFLEASPIREADALTVIRERPGAYAKTVLAGLRQLFEPSTHWHPHDAQPSGPHFSHRQVLGKYEAAYDRVVHGVPFSPVGLYIFLPFALVAGVERTRRLLAAHGRGARAEAALVVFCLVQIAFVVVVSSLVTFSESARYRYAIEAPIWLLFAVWLRDPWPHARALVARLTARSSRT